jgi:3-oxoacyl-[acyl-carrier-protein] synthase II
MVYIRSIGNISPQATFGPEGRANFGTEGHATFGTDSPVVTALQPGNRLKAIEPDYTKYIDAKLIRRMSRIIKMGVAAAMDCLDGAAGKRLVPDAIVTGTAYGCLEDTVTFLRRMVENKEEMLTPTAFIQSTHNTVGAQIALMLQCHAYNNTFVHRGFSFESAVLDAQMLLEEGQANNVLVGGVDEITDTSHQILERFGLFKDRMDGEGAVFFLLSKEPGGLARLDGMDTFYKPDSQEELEKHIQDFLARMKVSVSGIDLILLGNKGSYPEDTPYGLINSPAFKGVETENFKRLCGEYPTASAFALWLATMKIQSGLKRILIYNQAQQTHHSLYLVSACGT